MFFVSNFLKTLNVFPYSDHKVLTCTIRSDIQGVEQGKSFWKLDASVLKDDKYRKVIRDLLEESRTIRDLFSSHAEWLDEVKVRLRAASIAHCSTEKRCERAQESYLKSKETDSEKICLLKNDLKEICDRRLDALAVRAR